MRKVTQVIAVIGGVFGAVGGILLSIYFEDAKSFLDSLLSQLFHIPTSMVGYYVVAAVISGGLIYGFFCLVCFPIVWILDRRKRRTGAKAKPVLSASKTQSDLEQKDEAPERTMTEKRSPVGNMVGRTGFEPATFAV